MKAALENRARGPTLTLTEFSPELLARFVATSEEDIRLLHRKARKPVVQKWVNEAARVLARAPTARTSRSLFKILAAEHPEIVGEVNPCSLGLGLLEHPEVLQYRRNDKATGTPAAWIHRSWVDEKTS